MDDISVILNVYKRPHTLEQQIQAIKNQSIPVKGEDIHVWFNRCEVQQFLPTDQTIKTYVCNWNTKFFGRFTIPLLCKTKYIAIFDDDVIPERNWFKNCIDSIEMVNGIMGGSGVTIKEKRYRPMVKHGWNGVHLNTIQRVDLVGHAWFFRQEWLKYLWYEKPVSWDNGEDIMFSFLAQKYGNINTFVPPHPETDLSLWSSNYNAGMTFGDDNNASFKLGAHYGDRDNICIHCIDNGWKTVNNIK